MLTAIFKIIELLLRLVNRHLSKLDAEREEILDEKYRKAMADGDYPYAGYLLSRRVRQKRRSVERQRDDKHTPDRPR